MCRPRRVLRGQSVLAGRWIRLRRWRQLLRLTLSRPPALRDLPDLARPLRPPVPPAQLIPELQPALLARLAPSVQLILEFLLVQYFLAAQSGPAFQAFQEVPAALQGQSLPARRL